jgi:radical SAM protein with 4Fe4S-binding SPASM domain
MDNREFNIPKTIQILTNLDCNLDCDYCYENKKDLVNDIEDIKNYINIELDKISREDNIYLIIELIGGESLMHVELLEEIISYMESLRNKHNIENISYSISSNGTLIGTSSKVQRFIQKYKDIINIAISIDGLKDTHDKHRIYKNTGKGTYDDVIRGLDWLKENRFPMCKVGLKATYTHETIRRLFESIKYLMSLGCYNDIGSNPVFEEHWNTKEDSDIILSQIIKVIDYVFDTNIVNESKILYHILGKLDLSNFGYNFVHENKNWCGSCTQMICIGFDKKVYGCNRFCTSGNDDLKIGYLTDDGIEVTNQKLIDEVSIQYSLYPDECGECDLHSQCASCAAIAYEVNPNDPKQYIDRKNMCGWTHAVVIGRYYFRDRLRQYRSQYMDFKYWPEIYDKCKLLPIVETV